MLKKQFIPHEDNNYRPYMLRNTNIRYMVAIVLLCELIIFSGASLMRMNREGGRADVLPVLLSQLTNEERQEQSLHPLEINPQLNTAAEMKAKDMAEHGYFAHTSPTGKTPWYWIEQTGYQYKYAGENLAVNFSDSIDVTRAWMNSPTHKANIVKGNYTEVGTGVATGMYEGRKTIFVAQVYANPIVGANGAVPQTVTPAVSPVAPSGTPTSPVTTAKPSPVMVTARGEEIPVVLGAETAVLEETPAPVTEQVLILEPTAQPTAVQKALASPRNTTNTVLSIVFGIVAVSLLLYVFIKMRHHHVDLITNGLVLLAIIGAMLVANYYLSYKQMMITQSYDYSLQDTQAW